MAIAYPNDPHSALREHFFDEINQPYDPWIIIERIVSFPAIGQPDSS